jgi:hypothetical protein
MWDADTERKVQQEEQCGLIEGQLVAFLLFSCTGHWDIKLLICAGADHI